VAFIILCGNNSINVCAVNPVSVSLLIRGFRAGVSSCVKLLNLLMAKSKKEADKKTPKEASNLFHNIMKASVKNNPKPTKATKKK
jgi:hypothetical protein